MTRTRFLALLTALALLLAIPTSVFAQNAKPHVFVGTATLDGATAADGAAVTAWVGGEQVAATTVKGGEYDILVGDSVGYAGETVSFKLSGADASETAAWVEGGGDIVNLTAATGSSGAGGGAGSDGEKGATGNRGLKGVAGPAGPAGADGAAGPAGPAGATGSNGSDGSDGAAGSSGSSLTSSGSWSLITSLTVSSFSITSSFFSSGNVTSNSGPDVSRSTWASSFLILFSSGIVSSYG